MFDLPVGTVTFLFTDIVGSTPLWEKNPRAMRGSLARHNTILKEAIEAHDGRIFKVIGDAFQAAFVTPLQAVEAAIAAQSALAAASWGETGPLLVRMGIHTGAAEILDGDYSTGHALNRLARIMSAGHGGQILLSLAAAELIRNLPGEVQLKDLGEHYLKGLTYAEHIYQVLAPGLPVDFPPLVTKHVPRGYRLLEQIGSGRFGAVYRAVQPDVGREVAVKVILPQYANDAEFIRRFEAEALTAAQLEHPHIVPLYDYWREPDGAYLMMRLFRGGSLQAALREGLWPAERAAKMVEQIASALAIIHNQGIIHQNIKPTNILLDEDGNAYISDFGMHGQTTAEARFIVAQAGSSSLAYFSPEQILDETLTPQTDLYSLGIVLYETLTGTQPFARTSPAALIQQNLEKPLPQVSAIRPDLPRDVDEVIHRATAKKPDERYPDALSMAVAFRQAILGESRAADETGVEPMKGGPAGVRPVLHLPVPATPFIGRRTELEQIKSLVQSPTCQLLTLTGPGGTGKTRLAIKVATEINGSHSDGVYFVPLDSLNPGEVMVSTIAKALNFFFYQGETLPRQQLLDYLREKHILLILDNFEQVIDAQNLGLVLDILATAKGVKILATSRTRLNVQGEQLFAVGGLEIPEVETLSAWDDPEERAKSYSAVALFVERARRVRPSFRLTHENLASVTKICQSVQGVPLGIELAAAWLELLPPDEIAAEIIRGLDFLETDLEGVPERQRSLRAVFESSWKLLKETERETIQKLTVFQSSFSREAAEQVSGASLRTLLGLANKSWLQQAADGHFQLHELLRQYANEVLRTNPEVWLATRDAHSGFYATFVEEQGRALRGAGQIIALDAIAREFNSNIRTAFFWLIERGQARAIADQMMPGLFHFCLIRGHGLELLSLLKQARQAIENETGREGQVRLAILMTAETYMETRYGISEDLPKQKLAKTWAMVKEHDLADEMGFWFVFLAREYVAEIAFDDGSRHFHGALSRIRSRVMSGQEDSWVLGWCLMFLGRPAVKGLADEEKAQYLSEALAIFQKSGVLYEQALTLLLLGDAVWHQKKSVAESVQHYQTARELFDQVGDQFGVATIWRRLAEIYLVNGDFEQAFHAFREHGQVYESIGSRQPPTGSRTLFGNRDIDEIDWH